MEWKIRCTSVSDNTSSFAKWRSLLDHLFSISTMAVELLGADNAKYFIAADTYLFS